MNFEEYANEFFKDPETYPLDDQHYLVRDEFGAVYLLLSSNAGISHYRVFNDWIIIP